MLRLSDRGVWCQKGDEKMLLFILGISLTLNFIFFYIKYKEKEEKELKQALKDREVFKDFYGEI